MSNEGPLSFAVRDPFHWDGFMDANVSAHRDPSSWMALCMRGGNAVRHTVMPESSGCSVMVIGIPCEAQ